jgi:hypothetical protein
MHGQSSLLLLLPMWGSLLLLVFLCIEYAKFLPCEVVFIVPRLPEVTLP